MTVKVADAMVETIRKFENYSGKELAELPMLPLVIARRAPAPRFEQQKFLRRRKGFHGNDE